MLWHVLLCHAANYKIVEHALLLRILPVYISVALMNTLVIMHTLRVIHTK
jgi:hypothetical protein